MSLVVHSGGWEASPAEISAVAVPEATETYTPVPYDRLLDEIKFNLPRFNLHVAGEKYALAREGKQLFGILNLENGTNHGDWSLLLGVRSSYDRSLSVELGAGARVFICDNMSFSAEVMARRKHTPNIFRDLPGMIYGMLSDCVSYRERIAGEIEGMKGTPIGDGHVGRVLVEVLRNKVIAASYLPKVFDAWEKPTHEEFQPRNAWSLFNAFTEVMKSLSPRSQMEDSLRLTNTFRNQFGLGENS